MLTQKLTVAELLCRCRLRPVDDEAWSEFVRRYDALIRGSVLTTYYRRVKQEFERREQFNDAAAEDLVQSVYMRLIDSDGRALKHFSGQSEASLCSYLKMISVNVVRDYFREVKALKRPKISVSLDQLLDEQKEGPLLFDAVSQLDGKPAKQSVMLTTEEVDNLLNVILTGANRDRDRLIFKLRYYDGLTLEEIRNALHLNLSKVSVGSVLNRTAMKLRNELQRPAPTR